MTAPLRAPARGWRTRGGERPAEPPLRQQFVVHRTGGVGVEAMLEGVPEVLQLKMGRTPLVGSVQKRTVLPVLLVLLVPVIRHRAFLQPDCDLYRQAGAENVRRDTEGGNGIRNPAPPPSSPG